jgi:DNA-binding NtrC family response regulator
MLDELTLSRVMPLIDGDLELAVLSQVPVLIGGENRAHRRACARFIHETRMRERRRFMTVSCNPAAHRTEGWDYIVETPAQAVASLPSWFGCAQDGTLFIDNLDFMGAELQQALSAALDHDENRALPSGRQGVRLLTGASTEWLRNPGRRRFSERLFYRVNVMRVECTMAPFHAADPATVTETPRLGATAEFFEDTGVPVSVRHS